MKRIGLFGGTFDPVHNGHLRSAVEVLGRLSLDAIHLLPAHQPPHKDQPETHSAHRFAMLAGAVDGEPGLIADDRELQRDELSYSVNTLREFRQEFGNDCVLTWIMGSDALNHLDTWHEWPALFELANVLVLLRPEAALTVPQLVLEKFGKPQDAPADIARQSGGFYQLALSQLDISSSDIRDRLQGGRSIRYLVPNSVVNYIQAHRLYA